VSTATINGAGLYYAEAGKGTPCLALHGGLGYDHSYLKSTLRPLEDVLRLVYYDHRGNGRSERVPLETITIPQLAVDADAMREQLGLHRVAMMGHSYGGFIALEYAVTYPDRLSHLILLDTSPGVFEPTPEELGERADPSWVTQEITDAFAAMAERPLAGTPTTEDVAAHVAKVAPVYVKKMPPYELAELLSKCIMDVQAAARGFEVLAGWSVADKLDAITCPTLVVCGRYDLLTTPECSKRLSTAIPGAELLWLEDSGHFPWLEEPDAFFAGVKDFVARCP
jgi:proline iminopeptidase